MKSREDVIKGLECCVNNFGDCENCPYEAGRGNTACGKQLFDDAIALLKGDGEMSCGPDYCEIEFQEGGEPDA